MASRNPSLATGQIECTRISMTSIPNKFYCRQLQIHSICPLLIVICRGCAGLESAFPIGRQINSEKLMQKFYRIAICYAHRCR